MKRKHNSEIALESKQQCRSTQSVAEGAIMDQYSAVFLGIEPNPDSRRSLPPPHL